MNNQKIESIKSLYSGAKAYTMFLVEERQHNNDKVDYILDEEFYNSARLGFITNIKLAINSWKSRVSSIQITYIWKPIRRCGK